MKDSQQDSNWLGMKIDPPGPAEWIGKFWRHRLAAFLSCLMNPRITILVNAGDGQGGIMQDAEIIMGPNGWTATVDLTDIASSSGGSLELTDGVTDLTGVTKITVAGAIVGGTSAAATLTIIQQFKIQQNSGVIDAGDYWWAKTWDGTTLGSTFVKVAKPYKLRTSITSETIGGVSHAYTYSTDAYNRQVRANAWSTNTENELITPDALDGDIFYAMTFATTTPSDLSAVTLIDMNIDGREWGV